jgi:hypothetical protein
MVSIGWLFNLTNRRRNGKLGQLLKYNRNLDKPRQAPPSHTGNLPGLTDEYASSPGWLFVAGVRACQLMTLLMLLPALGTGCGTFMAHRMVQAPTTYPDWLAPSAHVLLAFNDKLLTNAPAQFADVGPPAARLHYRVVEPADYHLKVIATNWVEHGEVQYQFSFRAESPRTNTWSVTPRGTVILLHGYGLAEFSMVPWAWCLA